MGRPREFDPDEALQQAMMAFWQNGYIGTGVQALVDSTGVNRASLYGAFGNKQKLFLAAFQRYADWCLGDMESHLNDENDVVAGFRNFLNEFMDRVIETRRGCLIYNTALEITQDYEDIQAEVDTALQRIETLFIERITFGQSIGKINRSLNPAFAAGLVMSTLQSICVRSGGGGNRQVLECLRDGTIEILRPVYPN